MTPAYDASAGSDVVSSSLGTISFEIEAFLSEKRHAATDGYTILREPICAVRPHAHFWKSQIEFVWTAEADRLAQLVNFLENLTLKNCAALGGVILAHGGSLPPFPPSMLSAAHQACFYHLAPHGSEWGLTTPAAWDLHRLPPHGWADTQDRSTMHRPAIIFNELPLIQAIM